MADTVTQEIQIGDIVTWANRSYGKRYTPGPYRVLAVNPHVRMTLLNGGQVYFEGLAGETHAHSGVHATELRVDAFLTAAYRACFPKSDPK